MTNVTSGRKTAGSAAAASGTQVVPHHRGAQPVEVGNDDTALHPACHLVDEPGQPGIVAESEDGHLSPESGDLIQARTVWAMVRGCGG